MEEKVEKKFDFTVVSEAFLTLRNLSAKVEVKLGRKKTISVVLTGEKCSDKVSVALSDEGHVIIQEPASVEDNTVNRVVRNRKRFSIIVFVPLGTNIFIYDVHDAHVYGVRGSIVADIKKQAYLSAIEAVNVSLKCSDKSHCNMTNIEGNLTLAVLNHSIVGIQGNYQKVEITANESSAVTIAGNCHNLGVAVDSSSFINLGCKVKGKLKEKK
jgi:hypothetical protein